MDNPYERKFILEEKEALKLLDSIHLEKAVDIQQFFHDGWKYRHGNEHYFADNTYRNYYQRYMRYTDSNGNFKVSVEDVDATEWNKLIENQPIIHKIRTCGSFEGFDYDIDQFLKPAKGLIMVEVTTSKEKLIYSYNPIFKCKEVTGDSAFSNENIIKGSLDYKEW